MTRTPVQRLLHVIREAAQSPHGYKFADHERELEGELETALMAAISVSKEPVNN